MPYCIELLNFKHYKVSPEIRANAIRQLIYVALRLARLSKTVLVIGCGKDVDIFILFQHVNIL